MPNDRVLGLDALPVIHPRVSILRGYGTSTIIRLSLDPTPIPSGTMVRAVAVNWLARPAGGVPQQVNREISWAGVPKEITEECLKWAVTKNAQDITEEAAIGVMALLVHDLEGAEISSVLPIGSGGDYLLAIRGEPPIQIESSGVHTDPKGYLSNARLAQKAQQVLTQSSTGFVSVTAFSHTANEQVHSYLHCVAAPAQKNAGRGRKKPGRGRRKRR